MRFAHFACGQQNFSFREWLLSYNNAKINNAKINLSQNSIWYYTRGSSFSGWKGRYTDTDTLIHVPISRYKTYIWYITYKNNNIAAWRLCGLRRPNQTAWFCCILCVYRQSLFELLAVLQIICSKVHSQASYVIQDHYLRKWRATASVNYSAIDFGTTMTMTSYL